jgi:hypothetical protein
MYAALPGRGRTACPECGRAGLHLEFTGNPRSRRGYAQLWCESCVKGIHLSQTRIPQGVPMNDVTVPREHRAQRAPDFLLVQP